MKIYLGHSTGFDYRRELYEPIMNSEIGKNNEIICPHLSKEAKDSKTAISECDLFVAEVSYPSTGMGIELGWANIFGKPIICVYKTGTKISDSLKIITDKFMGYSSADELIAGLEKYL